MMESASLFNFNSSTPREFTVCTPVKPRLQKFLDSYSPEHLNLTPKHDLKLRPNENIKSLLTPENYFNFNEKCRTVKTQQKRRNVCSNCSFEGNQSFPRLSRRLRPIKMDLETPTKVKQAVDLVRVDGPNGLRFNTSLATGEVVGSPAQSQTDRLQQSFTTTKAVFIIEPNSSKILIVNNKACSLLGYSSGELCDFRFTDLLRERSSEIFRLHDAGDVDISEDGTIIILSGKVVELVSKDGGSVQVSLWMRQLENEGSCLVVAEPVICKNVVLTIDADTGTILSCDGDDAAVLFQAESSGHLIGLPVASLIPSIQIPAYDAPIPKKVSKQDVTGRTLDGRSFPLCLWISKANTIYSASWSSVKTSIEKPMFIVNVRVTYNVSGLLVVDESGIITACNQHFAMLTFGKPHSEVIGHHIENVIQNFCRESDLVKLKDRNRNMTQSVNSEDDDSASDTEYDSCEAFNGSQKSACMFLNMQQSILLTTREKSSSALCLDKSYSMVTHTPTHTQDMVSSISATEQRNDTSALPDVTSGMSGISIDDENYCQSSISQSRSENILRSEQSTQVKQTPSKQIEESDSIYYSGTSQHSQEVTSTGNSWLSLDLSEYKSMKANVGQGKEDSSSISLGLCDSNEISADFLTPINEMPSPVCEIENLLKQNGNDESIDSLSNDNDLETQTESAPRKKYEDDPSGIPRANKRVLRTLIVTSTPQHARNSESPQAVDCGRKDGTYRGVALHKDGTELGAVYTVSSTQLGAGQRVRCVWLRVCRASRAPAADNSLVLGNESASSRAQSMSLVSQCGEEQIAGEYNKNYANLKKIGNGAYSCVKMAYRRADRLPCVTKFIHKEKVGAAFWSDAPDGRRVPLELSLLLTLDHPNIVSVIDWYENEKYFQMVMEQHGAGMDLFEFIERRPRLDEPLMSYIFRQIGQAVEYLHSLNILHRDIKDENVIIDNKFHVKLIDFGSATFMSKDTLFSTFYGTIEYCSPEVLAGNKYAGPELEMWSMGMLLYGLTFFVKPFSDIEDTIQGALTFPQVVSEELEQLLRWMLCKEPLARCSVPQLMAHPWLRQPVAPDLYVFQDVVDRDSHEASPEIILSGGPVSPRSASPVSLADLLDKEVSMQCVPVARALSADNYSLHSSTDILDKYIIEADISSDATGLAARDIDNDCEQCTDPEECDISS